MRPCGASRRRNERIVAASSGMCSTTSNNPGSRRWIPVRNRDLRSMPARAREAARARCAPRSARFHQDRPQALFVQHLGDVSVAAPDVDDGQARGWRKSVHDRGDAAVSVGEPERSVLDPEAGVVACFGIMDGGIPPASARCRLRPARCCGSHRVGRAWRCRGAWRESWQVVNDDAGEDQRQPDRLQLADAFAEQANGEQRGRHRSMPRRRRPARRQARARRAWCLAPRRQRGRAPSTAACAGAASDRP